MAKDYTALGRPSQQIVSAEGPQRTEWLLVHAVRTGAVYHVTIKRCVDKSEVRYSGSFSLLFADNEQYPVKEPVKEKGF